MAKGACMAKGGMCGKGDHVWQKGGMRSEVGCMAEGGHVGKGGGHALQGRRACRRDGH